MIKILYDFYALDLQELYKKFLVIFEMFVN